MFTALKNNAAAGYKGPVKIELLKTAGLRFNSARIPQRRTIIKPNLRSPAHLNLNFDLVHSFIFSGTFLTQSEAAWSPQ